MAEYIYIRNFGPIIDVEINDIKPFTILIGESGSGKSTILKVLALFRWIYKMMCIRSYMKLSGLSKSPFKINFDTLINKNGLGGYKNSKTEIIYRNGSYELKYQNGKLYGTTKLVKKENLALEKISFVSDNRNIIPKIQEGAVNIRGMFYLEETYGDYKFATNNIKEFILDYLGVKFVSRKTNNGIKHFIESVNEKDNFSIKLSESSSGTQNTVPLSLIIEYFTRQYDIIGSMNKAILSYLSNTDNLTDFKAVSNIGHIQNKRVSIFVEEPELSLFPASQLRLIDFMVKRCFSAAPKDYSMSLMMATHSPYIINYLNVLFKRPRIEESIWLDGDFVQVYRVYNGNIQDLMLKDTIGKVIAVDTYDLAEPIECIAEEYQNLLN